MLVAASPRASPSGIGCVFSRMLRDNTLLFLVVVLATVLGSIRAQQQSQIRCPDKCLCFRTTVRCMFLQLDHIPKVPLETTILDLRFNKIKTIAPNTFKDLGQLNTLLLNNNHISRLQNGSFNGLGELRYLYLYKNRIRTIDSAVFHGLRKLEQLYLHFNDLDSFDAATFSNLSNLERLFLHNNRLKRVPQGAFRNLNSLRRLRLDSNALVCDCQLLWLAQMVKEKQHRTQVAATCHYPHELNGKSLTTLANSEFDCKGKPVISKGPTDVDVSFGGTAYFTCKVEGDPDPEVIWLQNNEIVSNSENPRYSIIDDGNTLMIENTQGEDIGYYECMAKNPMGEAHSEKAKMIASLEGINDIQNDILHNEPIRFEKEEKQTRSISHNEVLPGPPQITPRIIFPQRGPPQRGPPQHGPPQRGLPQRGLPQRGPPQRGPPQRGPPQRESPQRGPPQRESPQRGPPQIPENNPLESNDVPLPPSGSPQFVAIPQDVNITESSYVEFFCEVTGNPKPAISWTKDNTAIVSGPRIQISPIGGLTFTRVERTDSARYRCSAANPQGFIAAEAVLLVLVPPLMTEEPSDFYGGPGTPATFRCVADGVPLPVITWTKNGRRLRTFGRVIISPDGQTVKINHIKSSDEGEYSCRAENSYGITEVSGNLYVRNKIAPTIREPPQDITVYSGTGSVKFVCRSEGLPKPVIKWSKDGSELRAERTQKGWIEDDGTLNVYNITADDAGMYECTVQNHVGFSTERARLTVRDVPVAHPGDRYLIESFEEAQTHVNHAVNDTVSRLFQRDRSQQLNPHELLKIFRFPSGDAREIARAAEMIEQTIQIVARHVESGMEFNLTDFSYRDLLSPEKLELLNEMSGCEAHRRNLNCDDMCFHSKYRSVDGTCNNLQNPLWGASLTGFRRILQPQYENGFNTPIGWSKTRRYNGFFKPSARLVSTRIVSTEEISPDDHCTHMLMQWGQFLDHDITHALPSISTDSFNENDACQRSCNYSAPCFPVEVPPDDPRLRNHKCMEFTRSSAVCGSGMTSVFFNNVLPREQINQLTSYIDASQVYGSSAEEVRIIRNLTHPTGELRHGIIMPSGKPLLPFSGGAPIDCRRDFSESSIDCFLAGDIRANEQTGLLALHTIWFREHNRMAKEMGAINPHWDGDTVYHESRKIIGAMMQHITYKHWLPHILGTKGMDMLGEYKGYDPNVNPTIANVFATAAFRFGHSLINPMIQRLNASFQPIPEGHLQLHKSFFAPWRLVQEGGVDPIMRGLFTAPAKLKKSDQLLNSELTEKLFRTIRAVDMDLAVLNIQRGRDHALPGYTTWRKTCNLSVPQTFDEMAEDIPNVDVREQLKQLYGHPDNVDVWVGGLLEEAKAGSRVGPTFLCLLVDQFQKLREGDRFWYENPSMFKSEQLSQIRQANLGRVLCDNGDDIQDATLDAFVLPKEMNPSFLSCTKIPKVDLRVWSDCCIDCRTSGHFNSVTRTPSLTHTPGLAFRQRRQAEQFSHKEDREHYLMQQKNNNTINGNITFENEIHSNLFIKEDAIGSHKNEASKIINKWRTTEGFRRKRKRLGAQTWSGVPLKSNDLEDYENDMLEERIEGIENLVEELSRTVFELNKKINIFERQTSSQKQKNCKDEDGRERRRGEAWNKDPCTACTCRRGKVRCRVLECPKADCENPVLEEGSCCPEC